MSRVTYACSDWNGSTCDGDVFNYAYDGAGNLTSFDKWNGSAVETVYYLYNGANQIKCIDHNNNGSCQGESEALYQYDAYGNLTDDGTSTYTYDAANRLTSVTTGSDTTQYTYDGDGNRVSQTVNSTLTTYVLDTATPLTMVLSETSNGQTIHYWQGLDTLAQSDGTNVSYFGYDGLGSVRQLTDSTGAVGLAQTFDPYGNGYSKAGTATSSLGYTGEQTDSSTGFVFLRARYYNPSAGRFLNTDPSRQEENPYLYSMGDPVNFIDPTGLCSYLSSDYAQCMQVKSRIESHFNSQVYIDIPDSCFSGSPASDYPKGWTAVELGYVEDGLNLLEQFWGPTSFRSLFTPVTIRRVAGSSGPNGNADMRPVDPIARVNMPVAELDDSTFGATPDSNNVIGVLWGELYHQMDYNLSGKPSGANWENGTWQIANTCGVDPSSGIPNKPVTVHSGQFGLSTAWNYFTCETAYRGVRSNISSPADLAGGAGYGSVSPQEDFAHTYQVLTQALIGGKEVCTTVGFPFSQYCAKSNVVSNNVRPDPNFWIDDARLLFFFGDAGTYGANIAYRHKSP